MFNIGIESFLGGLLTIPPNYRWSSGSSFCDPTSLRWEKNGIFLPPGPWRPRFEEDQWQGEYIN